MWTARENEALKTNLKKFRNYFNANKISLNTFRKQNLLFPILEETF